MSVNYGDNDTLYDHFMSQIMDLLARLSETESQTCMLRKRIQVEKVGMIYDLFYGFFFTENAHV